MVIYGSIRGFKKEDIDKCGFPIDGIQLCVKGDLISDESEDYNVSVGTDVFLDINGAEYYLDGTSLVFKCKCESIMLDCNETYLGVNGDLAYSIVRNSYVTGIVTSGDYCSFDDAEQNKKLKKLKVSGSLLFNIGKGYVYKRCNRSRFY